MLYSKKYPNLRCSAHSILLLSLSLIIDFTSIVLPIPQHNSFFLNNPVCILTKNKCSSPPTTIVSSFSCNKVFV